MERENNSLVYQAILDSLMISSLTWEEIKKVMNEIKFKIDPLLSEDSENQYFEFIDIKYNTAIDKLIFNEDKKTNNSIILWLMQSGVNNVEELLKLDLNWFYKIKNSKEYLESIEKVILELKKLEDLECL